MQLKELERLFAANFGSPIFPVLAEYYLKDNQLDRAAKVCTIGLKHNSNNLHGEFILSKILVKEKKLLEAEKKLKIINKGSVNIEGMFLLIDILIRLNRNPITIKKQISKLNQLLPNHRKVKQYIEKYLLPVKTLVINEGITITKKKSKIIKIDNKLATKTMYNLLLTQKKYYHALEVLNVMELNKKNPQFIKKHKPDLLNKINKRNR